MKKQTTPPRDDAWYRRTFHVAWAQLAHAARMSKEEYEPIYREILRKYGGSESLGDLTVPQKEAALSALKQRGFQLKKNRRKNGLKAASNAAYPNQILNKAYGFWVALAEAGIVKNESQTAFENWALKRIAADNLTWSTDSEREQLVESLKLWAQRCGCRIEYAENNSRVCANDEVA